MVVTAITSETSNSRTQTVMAMTWDSLILVNIFNITICTIYTHNVLYNSMSVINYFKINSEKME